MPESDLSGPTPEPSVQKTDGSQSGPPPSDASRANASPMATTKPEAHKPETNKPGVTRVFALPDPNNPNASDSLAGSDEDLGEFDLKPGIAAFSPEEIAAHRTAGNALVGSGSESSETGGQVDKDRPEEAAEHRPAEAPVLGEYVIEEKIGSGGMGQVFRARHRTMDREVALKVLPQSRSNDAQARDRFYAEVRATAKLMHPNIVTAFDAGCYRSGDFQVHYLVMELIRGDLLSQRVVQSGPMSTHSVVDILAQSASALEYAHAQGIVHRDIKPSNMMLTPNGTLKILDFGLAVLRDRMDAADQQARSQIVGTVEFMAPEQINAPNSVDHRCDLYSLGATVFYLLTGRPMFSGELVQTALAQVHRKPPALYEVRSDVDIRLDSVFQSLVAKNPDERLQSAAELREKLVNLNLLERKTEPFTPIDRKLPSITPVKPTSFGTTQSTSQRQLAGIGIELGMISSRVSYINKEHKIEEVPVDSESLTLRNMLYSDGEQIAVGANAASLRVNKPDHIFYGMQRWYGLPLLERPFGGRQVPPEVLVAAIIHQMVTATRHSLPNATHAVVNVPACYDQMHRLSTRTACSIAGIELLQLLDKPLAATLAHVEIDARLARSTSADKYQKTFLVAMLNGAACEVTAVRVDGDQVHSLANVGDWKRGVVRWHDRMAKKLAAQIEKLHGASAKDDRSIASRIQRTVEKSFERLRSIPSVPFIIDLPGGKIESKLERDRVHDWVGDLALDCGNFAREVVERAGVDKSRYDAILLLGDIRWLPVLQRSVVEALGREVPMTPLSSSHLARGAALQAEYMMPPLKTDAPHAIGCSTYDIGVVMQEMGVVGAPKVLVAKDRPLPHQMSRTLRFSKTGERQPVLQFVEESRLGAMTWNKLGCVDLQTCFAGRRSSDPLQLRIELDESGLWQGVVSWPDGNDQIPVMPLNEPLMDVVSIRQWRDWLESLMLVNG